MNAIAGRYFWPALGLVTYALALLFFKPQTWQDVALPFLAEGYLSLPTAWFYYFREPELLNLGGKLHPQMPLFSLLWPILPPGSAGWLLHLLNITLLGSGLFRGKSPLMILLAAFAGFENGIPLFNALIFANFTIPHLAESYHKTTLRYFLLTLVAPVAALAGSLLAALRFLPKNWQTLTATLLGLSGGYIILTLVSSLPLKIIPKLIFTLYWTKISAKMESIWVTLSKLPPEAWLLLFLGGILIALRILLEQNLHQNEKQTHSIWQHIMELALFWIMPWILSLGQSWSLQLLLPARIALDGRLTARPFFQIISLFSAALCVFLAAQKINPQEINFTPPAALAVGIDDIHGRDDLLLVRHVKSRIYLLDLKVIPENYALAQMGIADDTGERKYLFSPAARRFFTAEQQYAEKVIKIFSAEPDRGILLSGTDPLKETRPFTRARIIFEQLPGTRLLLIHDR